MAFLFLANTVGGADNTTMSSSGAAVTAGYKAAWAQAGGRERLVRADAGTSHTFSYTCDSQAVTHFVLTNAFYFANGLAADTIDLLAGGATNSSTAASSMTLLGRFNQDWVKTISATSTSFAVQFNHLTSSATMYGSCYFANAHDFGSPPQVLSLRKEDGRFRPFMGYRHYFTETLCRLSWKALSAASVAAFEALPLCWPVYIYDENGDIFDHKLEHVILAEPWTKQRRIDGTYDLEMQVRRLKHIER